MFHVQVTLGNPQKPTLDLKGINEIERFVFNSLSKKTRTV